MGATAFVCKSRHGTTSKLFFVIRQSRIQSLPSIRVQPRSQGLLLVPSLHPGNEVDQGFGVSITLKIRLWASQEGLLRK